MIIHIWMHWFWITTIYLKGFFLFTVPTISLSCISLPYVAEAGLLANETNTTVTTTPVPLPVTDPPSNSSQLGNEPPADGNRTLETTPTPPVSTREGTTTEESTTPKFEDTPRAPAESPVDLEDVYGGGSLDAFQYPMKKFTKYSHLKYGKAKGKGKGGEDPGGEERRVESIKVVEEKVNINISLGGEAEKSEGVATEGGTSEDGTSDAPDMMTTTLGEVLESGGVGSEGVDAEGTVSEAPVAEGRKEVEVPNNETLIIENKVEESGVYTTVEAFVVRNRVAAATSAQNFEAGQSDMNAGSITGITLGILVVFSLFGAVSFVLYRRRYLNKPQVLHDKCSNLDSSGYIDETSLRENSEEMYSLDNDSFLNSLEAMTIQNYWTESVKHTKL